MTNVGDILRHQGSGLREAVRQTLARPFTSLMTIFSIALALCLPGLLLSTLELMESSNISIEGERKINLFIASDTPAENLMGLINQLTNDERLASIAQINPDEALQTLREKAEFGETLDALSKNPLPTTLILTPQNNLENAAIEALAAEYRAYSEIDQVRLDSEYLQKLAQLGRFMQVLVSIIAILFLALVCLVLTNNARLEILRRREEIEVTKLVGGTDGYIIRPFVYQALILCLLGSLLALVLIALIFSAITPALSDLTGGYQSALELRIGSKTRLYLPIITVIAAVTATWVTVKVALKQIYIQ